MNSIGYCGASMIHDKLQMQKMWSKQLIFELSFKDFASLKCKKIKMMLLYE